MRRPISAAVAALALTAAARGATAGVVVEQIEAYEVDGGDDANAPTRYAAIDFGGAATATPTAGDFAGVTFHGDASVGLTTTNSYHANVVAEYLFGLPSSPAHGLVSDLYASEADAFLGTVVNVQATTGVAAAPGTFLGGASVVNNSYVGDFGSTGANLDSQRRLDFMIARSGATFVAAAATDLTSTDGVGDADPAVWSSYNALAVSGAQYFNAAQSPGKPHADVSIPNAEASFAAGAVSGDAAALVGRATAAGQAAAAQDVVVRSLIMAGADKTDYARQTANNLSTTYGAGQPDYDTSLAILQGGTKALAAVSGGAATATPGTTQQGWAAGTVAAGGRSVVLFSAANAVTGLTASLNWDVTQSQPSADTIDTTGAGVIFPNLALAVCPVTFSGGQYVLGTPLSDGTLKSAATGDNVQYLYSSSTLAAGTYAFVVTGDATLPANVGFSYALRGTFASQFAAGGTASWEAAANWTNGIPNGPGAVATLADDPATVTLDGDRRVGQLVLSATADTVSAGTGGTLTIDDSGDSAGTAAPAVNVTAGTHAITAPVSLANGVAVTVAPHAALTLNTVAGTGGLTKAGGGSLTFTGTQSYGDTTVTAGALTLTAAASLNGSLTVTGGSATFAAGAAGGGIVAHTLSGLTVGSGGAVTLAPSAAADDRSVLVLSSLSLAGGRLDLGDGDLIVHDGSLSGLTAAAATGYAGGAWNGPGLDSSAANADPAHLTGLAVIQNEAADGSALFATFDGQPAAASDVIVAYALYGDTNLDGVIDLADYTRIDAGFIGGSSGWANGDFNYDGVIDGSDYTLIDNAFNSQGMTAAATAELAPTISPLSATAAVPEPAMAGGLAAGVVVTLGRRRRRRA